MKVFIFTKSVTIYAEDLDEAWEQLDQAHESGDLVNMTDDWELALQDDAS